MVQAGAFLCKVFSVHTIQCINCYNTVHTAQNVLLVLLKWLVCSRLNIFNYTTTILGYPYQNSKPFSHLETGYIIYAFEDLNTYHYADITEGTFRPRFYGNTEAFAFQISKKY